jgi:hypothetical protein
MWTFIFAGLLYLTGVAVVLVLKPSFMFTPDGVWKEFGIGKNESRYTPFTFWLFCLVWAFVSYIVIILVEPLFQRAESEFPMNSRRNRRNVRFENDSDLVFEDEFTGETMQSDLPKGYYILNRKASKLAGVPKYVYLGQEEP